MPDRHLVVVAHTHWDREWYLTHETFRYRLVGLLDGVLELLERDPAFRHFTLDGQTIVLVGLSGGEAGRAGAHREARARGPSADRALVRVAR